MAHSENKIVGAWYGRQGACTRGGTGMLVVYTTPFGTAHAGAFRKPWSVPDEIRRNPTDAPPATHRPQAPLPEIPRPHPLLMAPDKDLAAAFERLLAEPSLSKIRLTDWEFRLAADAPSVFLRYGGFTWKQRKYLREIVKKILEL